MPEGVAESMVRFAANSGVDTIDTAIGYGDSEQILGAIGVGGFKVVSKLMPLPSGTNVAADWVLRQTEASLVRLKVDCLYGLLLHRASDLHSRQGSEIYDAMLQLKSDGRVKKIGISIYSPIELEACMEKFQFDLVQAPLNLVDSRLLAGGWLKRLKLQGYEVHVRSAFLQGLLLMSRGEIPAKFEAWDQIWNKWHHWLAQHGTGAVAACLSYPLAFPDIDRVIVGANDLAQLQQIISASGILVKRDLPDLACDEESLINPAKWPGL